MSEIVGVDLKLSGGEQVVKTVGSLKSELRQAQNEVATLSEKFGATSKEAVNAAKRTAELKDKIGDAKSLVDAFNPDAKFKSLTASLGGVAGGFAAVQGGMALFGSESEDVAKTLLKVQSAMALSTGIQAVGESVDSFKQLGTVIKTQVVSSFSTLRGAIIATGVGALAVGIGLVVANFDELKKMILSAIPGLAKVGDFFGKLVDKITDFVGVTSEASRALDSLDKATKHLSNSTDQLVARYTAMGGKEKEIYEARQFQYKSDLANFDAQHKDKSKLDAKQLLERADLQTKLSVLELSEQARLTNLREAAEKERQTKQAEFEATKKAELDKEYKLELDALEKRKKLRIGEEQSRVDAFPTFREKRLAFEAEEARQKEVQADLDFKNKGNKLGLQIEQQIAAGAKRIENEKANALAGKKIAEEEATAKQKALDAVQNALTNLSMIAGKETVAGKALAIAASIINTYRGVTAALASAPPPFNFVAAAAVGAAGFAAVKNIVSVQVPGGGGGSAPSAPSLSTTSPMGGSLVQSNQVSLDQRSINAFGNKAIKAYVVETEISGAQQKIRRIEKQTTF